LIKKRTNFPGSRLYTFPIKYVLEYETELTFDRCEPVCRQICSGGRKKTRMISEIYCRNRNKIRPHANTPRKRPQSATTIDPLVFINFLIRSDAFNDR